MAYLPSKISKPIQVLIRVGVGAPPAREGTPMLKVVQENTESNVDATVHGGSLLDEIVRDGARQMLAARCRPVAAYVERFAGRSTSTVTGWWSATGTTLRVR